GPNRDAISADTGLLDQWPESGLQLLWKLEGVGKGYSSVSIAGGRLFTMGDRPDGDGQSQFLIAFDLDTRKELWAAKVGPPHSDGPRSTPTVDGQSVYAVGTDGDLVCLDVENGNVRWQKNFARDFGGKMMSVWKFSESPLVDGDRVVCTPGGPDATLVALNKQTGETIWKSAVPALGPKGKDGAGYSSAVAADIAGVRQYVQLLGRGVVGVEAETGRFLWGCNSVANGTANITSPVVHGDCVFASTSYGTGSALLKIVRDGESFRAEEVYFLDQNQFQNHHGGVVVVGDYLYGGHGQNKGEPACIELATGKIAWKAEAPARGSAAVVYADGHVIFRYDRGQVVLVKAAPEAFKIQGEFTPLTAAGPAWSYPVVHEGKLYLRHGNLLACYALKRT
ncbi:MAG: PQQ-binding-like beta-propeller repeat protein, partial [Pirellulales bacterium]|nr:PQQ-binding-like beta-propeller repeat protein [Pirellulales bacterium]